jgi:hypothetical protein
MKTLKELATEVLAVQNASNLSGVAHAFSRALPDIRSYCDGYAGPTGWVKGTGDVNSYPIVKLWVDKLASLAGVQSFDWEFAIAYDAVCKMAEFEPTPFVKAIDAVIDYCDISS